MKGLKERVKSDIAWSIQLLQLLKCTDIFSASIRQPINHVDCLRQPKATFNYYLSFGFYKEIISWWKVFFDQGQQRQF